MRQCVASALAAAIGGLVIAGAAWGTPPGGNGRIAYISQDDGATRIRSANPDGSDRRDLTRARLRPVWSLAWSPDGAQLAYTQAIPHPDDSESPTRWEVRTMNADGSDDRSVHRFIGFLPSVAWAPDGSRIAYVGAGETSLQVFTIRPDGTENRQLTRFRSAFVFGLTWSPDGTRLAFSADTRMNDRDERFPLWVVAAGGGPARMLAQDHLFPDWSPDGTRIATLGPRGIYAVSADTGVASLLVRGHGGDIGPVWSPDGTRIAFSSRRWGTDGGEDDGESVGVANADGTCPTEIVPSAFSPAWQPVPGGTSQPPLRCADAAVRTRSPVSFARIGQTFTMVDTVRSAGTDPLPDAVVTHTVTRGLRIVAAVPSQGTCSVGRRARCTLGSLDSGTEATVRVTVRATASSRSHWSSVRVATSRADPDPSSNSASTRLTVCDRLGGAGDDVLVGTSGGEILCGREGDDVIRAGGGDDYVLGGPGRDRIFAGAGNDDADGGLGRDRIHGGPGRDEIGGGPGSDHLFGDGGDDTFWAWDGWRDLIDGGPGRDDAFDVDRFDVVVSAVAIRTPPTGTDPPLAGRAAAFLAEGAG